MDSSIYKAKLQGVGMAEFMQRRGRRIAEGCGVLWHGVEGGLFVSIPHHLRFDPDPNELRGFLWKAKATGVRYPSTTAPGLTSGFYFCADKQYQFSHLHRNARVKVKKAWDHCKVVQLDPSDLLTAGFELNLQTMARQGRFDPEFGTERSWKRLIEAARQTPAIGLYGTLVDGHLGAYAITCREDGWFHFLHRMSRDQDLELCPNHILDFTLTEEITKDPALQAASMGYVSLVSGTDGLHEYKTRLGYSFSPHNSVLRLHPLLDQILTSRPVLRAIKAARSRWPLDQRLEKVEAVLQGARLSSGREAIRGKESLEPDRHRVLPAQ